MLPWVYNRFTEGFDTKDLQEVKNLLDECIKRASYPHVFIE